ncbi:Alpha/beta-hydrolase superfamily protein [Forsythia ovata]|uniref:Alpha/beta-hydrolase superfamily protein n=1 Tax=Forsythia ovata TaxID=205694 RepID=A0ABD1UZH3_9LAMI
MAACSQLLQIRYGEKSDGLVTCRDAEVPDSVVVRPKRKLDHAWMVYSSMNNHLRRIGVVSYYTEKNHVFLPCQKNLLIKYMINANIHPEKMASLSSGDAVEGKGKDMASHLFQEIKLEDEARLIICFATTLFNKDVCQDSFYQNLTPEKLKRVHEYNFDHPETSKAFILQQLAPLPERAFLGDIYRNLMAN